MGDLLKRCNMKNQNKLIELLIYIVVVVVGIVLLIIGKTDERTNKFNVGGESFAVVSDYQSEKQSD